ncbi:hypothetical protein TVAG_113010 [Trichomonas vaginalis G3]|uniref:Uncharacterized protein n=1 Tax=Trichomonas vaginalis (strain ATCC PRA-98 / G3) TaxID=412133 RepID=A2F748_TRIV3|nr:hypothetical protein TVAGG3_0258750 [Trichomonas vaginalis G3]EAX99285.1 hypothetical protein TVAG_113010 [Trichomonas vaginalis G3]KAI5524951.1 hypothetical protein TVAGG3_0258750 [Trichomonas vaginalis G3]|eukprot:XP_001312215.1 hypothetical protein [Trichomonas vaginalis G3]
MAFYQSLSPDTHNKNYAFDISVFKCGENETKRSGTLRMAGGDLRFKNNNITNNICKEVSSIFIEIGDYSSNCSFSTFRENNQTKTNSLYFYYNPISHSTTQEFSYCNVIENKCGTDNEQVLFNCNSKTNVDHCIFLNNTAKYMFKQSSKSILTISDSYAEPNSKTGSGTVTFKNIKGNYDFNTFTHLFNKTCPNNPKNDSLKLPYLPKFAKTAIIGLFPSKK